MAKKYIVSIDQSTQGTKALLFDEVGKLLERADRPHKQIINELGYVSHNPEEIYKNVICAVKEVVEKAGIHKDNIVGLGISNQRETSVIWDGETGKSLEHAVVWQCARASSICERSEIKEKETVIKEKTGMKLSPYFPAAKIAWLLEHVDGAKKRASEHRICHGTMDSWLVFKLTNGASYKTDYSNASRTQLFNIHTLTWDIEICDLFGIELENLAEVMDSNAIFGETDFEGYLSKKIPIQSVMGDSHAALFGQGCLSQGMIKATYGTGSSIMMNIGDEPVLSKHGVVTSLAWGVNGKVTYVLEGNLNYTGATITWLKDSLELIASPKETEELARKATKEDQLYIVPAFTGLGAPYWKSDAKALIIGMDRTTRKAEIVRATLESIAYQIHDVVVAMQEDSNMVLKELRVDGGPTRNKYLMEFQSDILNKVVSVPSAEELSGMGAAYMAGIAMGIWGESIFHSLERTIYQGKMEEDIRQVKISGWNSAVKHVLSEN